MSGTRRSEGPKSLRVTVAVRRRLAEHARRQSNRVDDPELANAEARVKRRLAADVVAERRVGDLDDEQHVIAGEAAYASRPRIDDDVGLEIGVLAEAEGCFRNEIQVVGSHAVPTAQQRGLHDLMVISLRRHRNQFPPDQLDALVLLHYACGDHRLDFGDREAAARQALCCRRDPGGRSHGSDAPLSLTAKWRSQAISLAQEQRGVLWGGCSPRDLAGALRLAINQVGEGARIQDRNPARGP